MKKRGNRYKQIILIMFALFLIILFSLLVNAGCCFNMDNSSTLRFCTNISEQECCSEYNGVCPGDLYGDISCDTTECIYSGCCVESCDTKQYSECGPPSIFVEWDMICEDNSHVDAEGCLRGCCVEIDSSNKPISCEHNVRLKKDCSPSLGPAVTTGFYAGITETQCDTICQQQKLPTGTVRGVVIAEGSPVAGAFVLLGGKIEYYTYTNFSGYKLENVPVGEYIITAYYVEYAPVNHTITIFEDQEIVQNFEFIIPTSKGDATGKVIDNETGLQIENAYVYYYGEGDFTDQYGKYLIKDVDSGEIDFTATAVGYNPQTIFDVDIKAGELNILADFKLTPSTEIPQECDNNILEYLEECELPNTFNNPYCTQTRETCLDNKLGTRDQYGNCNNECSCIKDPFTYQCVVGRCGAECDDGNTVNTDSCVNCMNAYCGDGYIWSGVEECDDHNNIDGDGCSSDCEIEIILEPGWLTGLVKNTVGVYLNGVLVEVIKDNTVIGSGTTEIDFSTLPPQEGFYEILDLPAGFYTVKASKQGYYTKTIVNVQINANQGRILHITLEPIPGVCLETLPPPYLTLTNVKGTTNIRVTWTQNCIQEFNVYQFRLYRNDVPIATIDVTDNEYIDDGDLSWDTDYEYKLDTIGDQQSSATRTINTGNALCEGIIDQELCVNIVNNVFNREPPMRLRATCNNNNQISVPILENCGDEASGRICKEVNDKTYCISPYACENLGIEYNLGFFPNILGMYYYDAYAETTCLENAGGTKRYCYIDYYKGEGPYTTIDRCLDCSDGTCFDYQSEEACEQENNCDYNNCIWYDTYHYAELGKGFCYQEGYKGTEYCNLCNKTNRIFENVFCTPWLCSKLGACVSIEDGCEKCTDIIGCESYTDQFSCINNSNEFNIPYNCVSGEAFEYSEDICDFKICKWLNNKCFKDGNDDNIADCEENNIICQMDTTPPTTAISPKPPYINSNGKEIEFSTEPEAYTYYCIDTGECCPDKSVLNKVLLPNEDFPLENKERNYNIYFFSIDNHDNTETIKKETIYVDTKIPKVTVTTIVTNTAGSDTLSDLSITVDVDEKSYCKDNLTTVYNPIASKINQDITTTTSVTYRLNDGFYLYSIECKDDYNNIGKNKTWLLIDRIPGITLVSPSNAAVLKNPVTINLTTTTQNYCGYEDENNIWHFIGENYGKGIYDPDTNTFKYEKTLYPNLNSRTYDYLIECYNEPELQNLNDSTNPTFTVDEIPPTTTANDKLYDVFDFDKWYTSENADIYLECNDPDDPGGAEPGKFDCDKTYYCKGQGCFDYQQFNTNPITFEEDTSEYISYYSVDNGGNEEEPITKFVQIDDTIPKLVLWPGIDEKVYKRIYQVTGFTDANTRVNIEVYNSTPPHSMTNYTYGYGAPSLNPKACGSGLPVETPFGPWPNKGSKQAYVEGDKTNCIFINDYLEFTDPSGNILYEIPRYRVDYVNTIGTGTHTLIEFSPGLTTDMVKKDSKLFVYTDPIPEGFFDISVNLAPPGTKALHISAIDEHDLINDVYSVITYDTTGLDITLISPADSLVNYNEFSSAGNTIPIEISTNEEFNSICTINHDADIIAQTFTDSMYTEDGKTHTYTLDVNSCMENNGYYCLIGGTSYYPVNYHHYTITCTDAAKGVSFSKDICFTVATYGGQTGYTGGENICTSTGCGTGNNHCLDCTKEYAGNKVACIAESRCSWCPSVAPNAGSFAETCLRSCSLCGDWTAPVSGECAEPTEPIDCTIYLDSNSCTSEGCLWCPEESGSTYKNSCLSNCNLCSPYTAISNRVCSYPTGDGNITIVP